MKRVLELIAQLPKGHQDVLALCGWCSLTYEEAAVALGIPVGTVRSRLSRARRRLRELGFDVDAEEDPVPGLQEVVGR